MREDLKVIKKKTIADARKATDKLLHQLQRHHTFVVPGDLEKVLDADPLGALFCKPAGVA